MLRNRGTETEFFGGTERRAAFPTDRLFFAIQKPSFQEKTRFL